MRRLLQIGFEQVGNWRLHDQQLALNLTRMNGQRNVLYAFVQEASVLYVGKTTGPLESRMGGYLRPSISQSTNMRNKQALLQMLREGFGIDIYAWADPGMHRVGDFHLNYAAGLEDSIIRLVAPLWNGARSAPTAAWARIPPEVKADTDSQAPPIGGLVEAESASVSEIRKLEENGVIRAAPVFEVMLGKTYFKGGFFNVPIRFAELFPEHGTEISIYCGEARTLIRATIDRKTNQANQTPRIYGRASLANWFDLYKQLNDTITIRVISTNEVELL
jgi:hypothetical protein